MKHRVHILVDAERDLLDIARFVADHVSVVSAEKLLSELEQVCLRLETLPNRGHIPPELARLDVEDYLEVHHGVYRIMYQVIRRDVYVHAVFDGRRELEDLLKRRMLR